MWSFLMTEERSPRPTQEGGATIQDCEALVGPLVEIEAPAAVDEVSRAELRCGRGCLNRGVGVAEIWMVPRASCGAPNGVTGRLDNSTAPAVTPRTRERDGEGRHKPKAHQLEPRVLHG